SSASPGDDMGAESILVVDDEPQILKALHVSLSAAGYSVTTASTAGEAAETLRAGAFDTMILDLGLPDLDGKELITSVRQWSDIPIIVLSARHLEGETILALDAGANDYVGKPFGAGEPL